VASPHLRLADAPARAARTRTAIRHPWRVAIVVLVLIAVVNLGVFLLHEADTKVADEFRPYSPDTALPYARHWRLFRTANDAFMTANVHREGTSPFDLLQPAYSGLQSGAVHPTAEAHSIVADHVMPYARAILDKRAVVQAEPPR